MNEKRINDLESTIAHLEHKIEELSQLSFEQGKVIDYLKAKLGHVQDKVSEMEEMSKEHGGTAQSAAEFAAQNKPPHY